MFTIGLTPALGFTGVIVPAIATGNGGYGAQDSLIILDTLPVSRGGGLSLAPSMGAHTQGLTLSGTW